MREANPKALNRPALRQLADGTPGGGAVSFFLGRSLRGPVPACKTLNVSPDDPARVKGA